MRLFGLRQLLGSVGSERAEQGGRPGDGIGCGNGGRRHIDHSGGCHVLHRGVASDTNGPSFGNYDLGGAVACTFSELRDARRRSRSQRLARRLARISASSRNAPRSSRRRILLNHSGNLVLSAPTPALGRPLRSNT